MDEENLRNFILENGFDIDPKKVKIIFKFHYIILIIDL